MAYETNIDRVMREAFASIPNQDSAKETRREYREWLAKRVDSDDVQIFLFNTTNVWC